MLTGLYIATAPVGCNHTSAPPACRQPSIALAHRLTVALASTQVLRTINALYTRLDHVILHELPRYVSGEAVQAKPFRCLAFDSSICKPANEPTNGLTITLREDSS